MNKSLIELDGIPLFMYVLSALQDVDDIGNIYVVGPKSKIEELLKKHTNPPSFPPFSKGGEGGFKKNVIAVEQRDNLYENIWHTFLASIDGYSAGDEYQNPSLMDKAVFVVAGDMPLQILPYPSMKDSDIHRQHYNHQLRQEMYAIYFHKDCPFAQLQLHFF